jgi:hypothetical protein
VGNAVRLLRQGLFPPTLAGLQETQNRLIRYLESDVREVDFAMSRYTLTAEALQAVQHQIRVVSGEEAESGDEEGNGNGSGNEGGGDGDEDDDGDRFQEVA